MDDSNKWSNIGFDEEIAQVVWIEVKFMSYIWSSAVSPEVSYLFS